MKFINVFTSKDARFSLGIEEVSGRRYLSIPVSNSFVDYEEYYELTPEVYEKLLTSLPEASALADLCRLRKNDDKLIIKPGSLRGSG